MTYLNQHLDIWATLLLLTELINAPARLHFFIRFVLLHFLRFPTLGEDKASFCFSTAVKDAEEMIVTLKLVNIRTDSDVLFSVVIF